MQDTTLTDKIKNFFDPSVYRVYLDKRIGSIFVLGIAQGLPWVMIGSMLTVWLQESGVTRTNIGLATLIFTVYAVNFLWSPIVEIFKPKLLPKLGHRQSWILLCLGLITVLCFVISMHSPTLGAQNIVLFAFFIAIFSATQDIAIDAYRVDSFAPEESDKISAGAAAATAGWWTGYAGIGAIPLFLSDHGWSWPNLYMLLGYVALGLALISTLLPNTKTSHSSAHLEKYRTTLAQMHGVSSAVKQRLFVYLFSLAASIVLLILGIFTVIPGSALYLTIYACSAVCMLLMTCVESRNFSLSETEFTHENRSQFEKFLAWMHTALVSPIQEFFLRNGLKLALGILSFVILFKVGEAFLGRMSVVFYKEIGFSNSDIATYAKLLTWWLTIVFALIAAGVNARFGLFRGLFISGIAMASTNLLFSLLALVGPELKLFIAAIVLDGFSQAWSTVAFVAFISFLCNHAFSASQYALMASLGNLGRTSLSSSSGYFVDVLDGNWALFFAITTLMVIPSLIILWRLKPYIHRMTMNKEEVET